MTGEPGLSLDDWMKGETKEAPRISIDKIENSWSVKETKFEHVVEQKTLSAEEELKHLREEIIKKDDRIHELEKDNANLKAVVAHTEEKLNIALSELTALRGDKEEHQ